ncbi:MAG: hypothetical protein IPG04_09730 [Polyangiaceae bacterium]|nr:hypothetical protein [Polyangiaceae bacterium]
MGSTVSANGKVVATSTSGHFATSVPGDMRLVGQKVPTLLPNFVESKKIYTAYPALTRFGSGLIWVEGTKAGPKSDPIDTWPGVVIPSAMNSYATSKPGSGSNNVYAEAKRVYCFTHDTLQNEGNSSGKLLDKPLMVMGNNSGKGEGEGQSLLDGDGNSDSDGEGEGEDGDSDESDDKDKKDEKGPDVKEPCTLVSAKVTEGSREQSQVDNHTAYLQIEGGAAIEFAGEISEPCNEQHPLWNIDGSEHKEMKVAKRPTNGTLHSIASQHIAVWDMLRVANTDPKSFVGEFNAHHGTERRVVHVFPKAQTEGLKKQIFKGFEPQDFVKKFKKYASFIGDVKIKALNLDATVNVKWAADDAKKWRMRCELDIGLSGTIFELAYKEYFDLTILTGIPVVGQILAALYAVNKAIRAWNEKVVNNVADLISWIPFWGDDWSEKARKWTLPTIPLPQAFVDLKIGLTAKVSFKIIKFHAITPYTSAAEKKWHVAKGEGTELGSLTGSIDFAVGLSLGNDKTLFEAGGEVRAKAELEGKLIMWKVTITLKPVKLSGKLYFNYDLLRLVPWVATQKERDKLKESLGKFGLNPVGKLEKPLFDFELSPEMVLWEKQLA